MIDLKDGTQYNLHLDQYQIRQSHDRTRTSRKISDENFEERGSVNVSANRK